MDTIVSPPKRHVYKREDWYLYYDPANITWIKVNEDGKKILSEFEHCQDYKKVVERLKEKYGGEEPVISKFVTYLVEKSGYLHKDTYHKRTITFPRKSTIPRTLYLHPTYRCNLRCFYCYNGNERNGYLDEESYEELKLEDYRELFRQARQLGIAALVYSGGEPLLRKDLFEIANMSKDMGFYNNLFTNGTLITKDNAALIIRYFDRISVSIDSFIEEENDCMRGAGVYKKALQGIRYLRNLNGKVTCLGVVHPQNIDNALKSWDYFVNQMGCLTFMPQAYIPKEDACKDIQELEIFAKKYGKMRCKINYWNEINVLLKLCNNCGMCASELAIGTDGNVFPCQGFLTREFICGNIKKDSLKNILENSPILKRLREFTVDDIEGCRDCEFKYLCGGGCRATNSKVTGDFHKNNRYYCAVDKEIIINSMFEMSSLSNEEKTLEETIPGEKSTTCL